MWHRSTIVGATIVGTLVVLIGSVTNKIMSPINDIAQLNRNKTLTLGR